MVTKEQITDNKRLAHHVMKMQTTLNCAMKDAIIETIKQTEDEEIVFDEWNMPMGTAFDGTTVRISSIRLNENKDEVLYAGESQDGYDQSGELTMNDPVSFDWYDVLVAVNNQLETEE